MGSSSIEWTDFSLNPGIFSCSRFGVGCDHCYAISVAEGIERKAHGDTPYAGVSDGQDWIAPVRVAPIDEAVKRILAVPKRRDGKPRKVFVTSMADFLHESIPLAWIVACIEAMSRKPDHIWQCLTKRGHRWPEVVAVVVARLGAWPANVWAGLSVAHQPDTRLIHHLLKVPAAVRFLSVEPLVGPVDLVAAGALGCTCDANQCTGLCAFYRGCPAIRDNTLARIDWVIVGGESGPNARPMHANWARSLRDQCIAAGVPYFFKQWGEWAPGEWRVHRGDARAISARDGRLGEPTFVSLPPKDGGAINDIEYRDDMAMISRVGKKAAGRLLDGREWSEVPNG